MNQHENILIHINTSSEWIWYINISTNLYGADGAEYKKMRKRQPEAGIV